MPFAPKFKPYTLRYHKWGLPLRNAVTIMSLGATALMGVGAVLAHYFVSPTKGTYLDWLGATETQVTDQAFESNFKQSLAVFRRHQEKDIQNELQNTLRTRSENRVQNN